MEINKYTDIVGAVAQQDMVEGRMVCLVSNAVGTVDFGSRADLMGIRLPHTAAEALRAKYTLGFALDNRPTPIMEGIPSYDYALRGGWDQAINVPFTATVHLTHQANTLGQTVLSGTLALAFDKGVFTVYSGAYVDSASLVPGAYLEVLNVADDGASNAGKLSYTATASLSVAVVERYDSTNHKLTFRTL